MERAEGVFLWVSLVTTSLREGLSNHDTPTELLRRLVSLPTNFEMLFRSILDVVSPCYHVRVAEMLQLAVTEHTLHWEVYSHYDREYDYPG